MPFQDINFCWGLVALEKYPIDRLTSADLVPYQRQWLEETRFLNIYVCNACISLSNLGHICLNVDHLVGVERCVMVCGNRWLAVTLFSAQQKKHLQWRSSPCQLRCMSEHTKGICNLWMSFPSFDHTSCSAVSYCLKPFDPQGGTLSVWERLNHVNVMEFPFWETALLVASQVRRNEQNGKKTLYICIWM